MAKEIKLTRIANPIYDVVFRYLLEDNRVARLFISALLGKKVLELTFQPTEYSKKIDSPSIIITRMDFSARILQEDGTEQLVIIELQKAKFYHQMMRFRRYLGKQYQNPENKKESGEALPIFPIYILGQAFTEEKIPVIRIQRDYVDLATKEKLSIQHPFVEGLTHDAIVVQIPWLKNNRRTRLEKFLSIFDQDNTVNSSGGHFLEINENNYPKEYQLVIQRLNAAAGEPEMEEDMWVEDEIIGELIKRDQLFEHAEKMYAKRDKEALKFEKEAEQRKNEALKFEKEAEQRKNEALKFEKEAEQRKNEALKFEKEAEQLKKTVLEKELQTKKMIKKMSDSGMSLEEIISISGITGEKIKDILKNE